MPKSLYSSRECPDSMADRLAAHRFGVFACTVLTVFGSLWISNAMSVREEERVLASALDPRFVEVASDESIRSAPAASADPLGDRGVQLRLRTPVHRPYEGQAQRAAIQLDKAE